MSGPLEGIKVLDLSRILAGPWAAQLLGDYGADVVKVERPGQGDDTRQWGPPWLAAGGGREAAYFLSTNRNKRSLTVDIGTPRGQQLIRELASCADVLIENFKVGTLARYGLAREDLTRENASLIYCSISAYGQTGSRAAEPGYDAMIQASGGLKCIDVPLYDSQVAWLANQAMNYLIGGEVPERLGTAHPNLVPYQTFASSDGYFTLAVGNDRQFAACARTIGQPQLARDESFASNAARVRNRDALVRILSGEFRQQTTSHWLDALREANVPAGPINTVADVLTDGYAAERGLVKKMHHGLGADIPTVANPVNFSRTSVCYGLPPPLLGADTEAVLRDWLGYSAGEIADLATSGAI